MDAHGIYDGLHIIYHDIEGQKYHGQILSVIDKWTVWIKLSEKIDSMIDRIICPISQVENDRCANQSDDRDNFCTQKTTLH